MAYLVDTSILGRLANTGDAHYAIAAQAVLRVHRQGEQLHTTPQNLIEFRNVATRPTAVNGLGLTPAAAEAKANVFEATFVVLPETPEIYAAWKDLAQASVVMGKQVHDARLVAICHVYAVTHILTFNVQHFARFASFGPGIMVVDPTTV